MKRCSRAGQSLVEFALVLPLLLILVFGIIDFGIAMYDKAVVTNAAREGARAGIVFRTNPANGTINRLSATEIDTVVRNYCQSNLVTFGTPSLSVAVNGAGGAGGTPVSVTVTYPYQYLIVSRLVPGLNDPTLTATAVMRME